MSRSEHPNIGPVSTTYKLKRVRISSAPQAQHTVPVGVHRWLRLPRMNRREKQILQVTFRGGPEGWWLVEARGRHGVFPWDASIGDIMSEVCQDIS